MKSILLKSVAAAVAMMAVACSSGPSLKEEAERANQSCPMNLPGVGKMESITFDDNTLTFRCLVLNRNFPLKQLEGKEELMKAAIMPMLPNLLKADKGMLGKALEEEKASLAVNYYSKGPKGADITVTFTPEEIKDVMEGKIADDDKTKLRMQVEVSNAMCPIRVDGETEMTGIKYDNDYVVYEYSVDDSETPDMMSTLNEHKDELTKDIKRSMKTDRSVREIVKLTKSAGAGFIYRYNGKSSGEVCEVKFENSEL